MQITIKDNKIKDLSTIELNNLRTRIFFIKMICFVLELSQTEPSLFMVSSLFPHTYKKVGSFLQSLVPHTEAFALPIQSERATKESPTPIRIYMPQKYLYTETVHRYNEGINIPLSYLPLQCSLAVFMEFAKFLYAKNKA